MVQRPVATLLFVLALWGAASLMPTANAAPVDAPTDGVSVPAAVHIAGACVLLTAGAFLTSVYLLPTWLLRLVVWNSHPSVLWCARTTSRVCSLTVDDAPSPSTPAILDILREHKVTATFFIISGNIPGNEDVLRRIVREGHALGNHLTEDRASILDELHVFEQKLQECDRAISEFQQAADAVPTLEPLKNDSLQLLDDGKTSSKVKAGGDVVWPILEEKESSNGASARPNVTKWMRPASGWFTTPMREITARHGYRICLGSVYPHDAQIRSEVVNSLHLRARTRCGSVIIVHDRSWTVGVLKTALPELTRKFAFVSLDELIAHHKRAPAKATG